MAAQAVPFALAPAFANPDILNFSEPAAAKLFKSAIEPLSIKFNCSPENGGMVPTAVATSAYSLW
jgi:hypothetical protein